MSTRSDLVAAMTVDVEVDGRTVTITGHPTQPDVIGVWDAWPVWVTTRWRNACVVETDWQVIVALPAAHPSVWTEAGDLIVAAVGAVLYSKAGAMPTRVDPVQILLANDAPMPAVQFAVTV